MDLNKVLLVGRVTANPELRTTPGGQAVTTIGVATNRTWTDKSGAKQEEPEFHSVVLWGRQAEVAAQYLVKGATVLIEGRIRTRSWTDKTGGQRRTTEIMAERMQLGPRPMGGPGGGGQGGGFKSKAGSNSESSDGPSLDDKAPSLDEVPVINLDDDEIKAEDVPF